MSFKKCQVVMLPTNEKSNIFLDSNNKLALREGSLFHPMNISTPITRQHLYILSDDDIKDGDWYICWETINDVALNHNFSNKLLHSYCIGAENYKKIIATTTYLKSTKWHSTCFSGEEIYESLPQPSQEFIDIFVREYNKGNIITDVMVEYEDNGYLVDMGGIGGMDEGECCWKEKIEIKINPKDNTITIKKVKDSWNKQEVKDILIKLKRRCNMSTEFSIDDWANKNIK